SKEAEGVPIGAGKLIYEPYLMGERSPHLDPDCRGTFIGLSAGHTRANLIRAVMEGVSYSQKECVDIFREMGVPVDDMLVCGGGAKNPFWRQMLCDLYGCPVSTIRSEQGGALGVAILAGVAAGIYPSVEAACERMIEKKDTCEPVLEHTKAYEPYFALYKSLYGVLAPKFRELAEI
ncbi:MAG: FGGY-family carbohydrate kinase, partial [Eubacteriales bacterium]|nr:FGGY-family carbohydrate kinase [Eubacteriales bacterium]